MSKLRPHVCILVVLCVGVASPLSCSPTTHASAWHGMAWVRTQEESAAGVGEVDGDGQRGRPGGTGYGYEYVLACSSSLGLFYTPIGGIKAQYIHTPTVESGVDGSRRRTTGHSSLRLRLGRRRVLVVEEENCGEKKQGKAARARAGWEHAWGRTYSDSDGRECVSERKSPQPSRIEWSDDCLPTASPAPLQQQQQQQPPLLSQVATRPRKVVVPHSKVLAVFFFFFELEGPSCLVTMNHQSIPAP